MIEFWALVAAVIGCTIAYKTWVGSQRLRRAEFIRTYRWPRGLLGKLNDKHPDIVRKDAVRCYATRVEDGVVVEALLGL